MIGTAIRVVVVLAFIVLMAIVDTIVPPHAIQREEPSHAASR